MAEQFIATEDNFQFILRVLNTNVNGKQKAWVGLTKILGVGRRFSVLVCKKAEIDMNKRAGSLTKEEVEKAVAIIQNPRQFGIPEWMLNRQQDFVSGKSLQLHSTQMAPIMREDLERLKRSFNHRGLRHYWGLRVRGQHTCTTGRGGRRVGVPGLAGSK